MAHSIACKTFCKSFTIISANDKHLNHSNNMKRFFVINAKDHKQYFIANKTLRAIMEYKYINMVDEKDDVKLYYDDTTFNELYYIENSTTKWLVVHEHPKYKSQLFVEEFVTLAGAKEYIEKLGLNKYRIVYGNIIYC